VNFLVGGGDFSMSKREFPVALLDSQSLTHFSEKCSGQNRKSWQSPASNY